MSGDSNFEASVIVPTYNRANIIRETLESILRQRDVHFEIIVVDDGSTDETPSILESYGERIRYLWQQNRGAASARNRGVRDARGVYLAFCDDDDIWLPDHLRRLCDMLKANPRAGLAFSNAAFFSDDFSGAGRSMMRPKYLRMLKRRKLTSKDLFLKCVVTTLSVVVVSKDALESIGSFDERVKLVHDGELALRMSLSHEIEFLNQITCHRRLLKDGLTRTMLYEDNYLNIIEELDVTDYKLRTSIGSLRFRRRLASEFGKLGKRCSARLDWKSAINAYERAMHWAWWNPRYYWHWNQAMRIAQMHSRN